MSLLFILVKAKAKICYPTCDVILYLDRSYVPIEHNYVPPILIIFDAPHPTQYKAFSCLSHKFIRRA